MNQFTGILKGTLNGTRKGTLKAWTLGGIPQIPDLKPLKLSQPQLNPDDWKLNGSARFGFRVFLDFSRYLYIIYVYNIHV